MNLVGKKIIVTNPMLLNPYYKKGDILIVFRHGLNGSNGFKDKDTVLTECGNILIKTEYKVLEEE